MNRKFRFVLFFYATLTFCCIDTIHADNIFEIANIKSCSRNDKYNELVNYGGGYFLVSFSVLRSKGTLSEIEFNLIDEDNESYAADIDTDFTKCNAIGVGKNDYYPCYVKGKFQENKSNNYSLVVKAINSVGSEEIHMFKSLELIPSLKSINFGSKYDILELTNVSPEELEIVEVSGGEYVSVLGFKDEIILDGGRTHKLGLILNQGKIPKDKKGPFTDKITIKYNFDYQEFSCKIVLNIAPEGHKNLNDVEVWVDPAFNLYDKVRLFLGGNVHVRYVMTNHGKERAVFEIGGFKPPIYRDDGAGDSSIENCGTLLDPGESCEFYLSVYGAKLGKIEQDWWIKFDSKDIGFSSSIKIDVFYNLKGGPFLQITPLADGQSIKSIMSEKQKFLQLKYQLENISKSNLEIISINVPTAASINDSSFKVEYRCKILNPNEKCMVKVAFTPQPNWNLAVRRNLKVGYKINGANPYGRNTAEESIPILISSERFDETMYREVSREEKKNEL